MELWWKRLMRLFPGAEFSPQVIVVNGPPWNTIVMTHIIFRASVANAQSRKSEPYENEFMQRVHLRWGRITSIVTIEDTQRFTNVLPQLAAAGIGDATSAPIQD